MNEELIELTTEENIDIYAEEIIESEVNSEDLEQSIQTEEAVEIVEAEAVEEIEIEVEESVGWVGGDNTNHYSLSGRDQADQHPIKAITGLREELNQIESLQTVYSDKKQQADYYLWRTDNEHLLPANPYGLFVSILKDTDKIQICDGESDVFGVTVAEAAFVGNQKYDKAEDGAKTGRDGSYCLVVHSGLAAVRCMPTVSVGDYVTPNSRGEAKKSDGDYGYLVTALSEVGGVQYAIISLSVPSTLAKATADNLQDLSERMDTAEYNITSVTNVANSAYALAQDAKENAEVNSEYLEEKITEVLGRMDVADGVIGNLSESIKNANETAALARTIANNAVSAAQQIGDDTYASANEAIAAIKDIGAGSTSWAKRLDAYSVGEYSQAYGLTLEQAKSALENSIGIIHIPTVIHTEKYIGKSEIYEQEFSLGYYYTWNGERWVPSNSTAVNFSKVYIVGSEQTPYWVVTDADVEYNGIVYAFGYLYKWENGVWNTTGASVQENTLTRAVSAMHQTANEISAEVSNVAGSVAVIEGRVDANEASVQTLASWVGKDGKKRNIATIDQSADQDGSKIALVVVKDVEDTEDEILGGASIVLNDGEKGSYIQFDADHIDFTAGDFTVGADHIDFEAGNYTVNANKIDFTGDDFTIDADNINFTADNYETIAKNINLTGLVTIDAFDADTKNTLISSVEVLYARSSSPTTFTATTIWSATAPEWVAGEYMWQKTRTIYADGTVEDSDLTCIQGAKGDTGEKGEQGIQGEPGTPGADGAPGNSVESIITQYCISMDNTTAPTDGWSNDFDDILDAYYSNKQVNKDKSYYIWSREEITYSNGSVDHSTPTVNSASSIIASWCDENDKTKIHGSNIATGTITAEQISVSAVHDIIGNEELITNGSGQLESNTNFSSFERDDTQSYNNSFCSFKMTIESGAQISKCTDEFIPINADEEYIFSVDLKSSVSKAEDKDLKVWTFIDCYDVDKTRIKVSHHKYQSGTLTTLSAPLNNGDTVIQLTDASNWTNVTFGGYIIFWDYKNKFGYTYPPETYSQKYHFLGFNNDDGRYVIPMYNGEGTYGIDINNNRIVLETPWSGGFYEAGSPCSQGGTGSTFKYIGAVYDTVPTEWTTYTGKISGIDLSGGHVTNKFPPGTAFVKIGLLVHGIAGVSVDVWMTNVSLKKTTAGDIADNIYTKGTTTINGGQITTGSISADKIDAKRLSAITANLGSVTSGSIQSDNYSKKIVAWHDESICIDMSDGYTKGLEYSAADSNGNVYVTGLGSATDTDIVIPDYNDSYYTVCGIADNAFSGNTTITSVGWLGGIKSIGANAFSGCTNLKYVYLPDTVTVGEGVFSGCSGLQYVFSTASSFPSSKLDEYNQCGLIEEIIIPEEVDILLPAALKGLTDSDGTTTYTTTGSYSNSITLVNESVRCVINGIELKSHLQIIDEITNGNYTVTLVAYLTDNKTISYRYTITVKSFKPITTANNITSVSWLINKNHTGVSYFANMLYLSNLEVSDNNHWHFGRTGGWKISSNIDENMIDSDYFQVDYDGRITATDAYLSGTIKSDDGYIGGLKIDNDGLTEEDNEWSLTPNGLSLNQVGAKINAGNLSIYYDQSNKKSYMTASGPVIIKGENDTALELMTDTVENETVNYVVNLYGDAVYGQIYDPSAGKYISFWDYTNLQLKTDNGNTLKYPVDIIVDYQERTYGIFSSIINTVKGSGKLTFTIPAGSNCSNVVKYEKTSYHTRFKKSDGTWSNDFFGVDFSDILVSEFSQTVSNKNIVVTGNIVPSVKAESDTTGYNLGENGNRIWNTVYARTNTIQASDRNKKNTIQTLTDVHTQIFDALQPVSYKFNVNNNNRTHIGFIAQDVKDAVENAGLTTQDFAGYCEWQNDDGTVGCGLRYGEFIALCVDQIQKLKKQVAELENKINNNTETTVENEVSADIEAEDIVAETQQND